MLYAQERRMDGRYIQMRTNSSQLGLYGCSNSISICVRPSSVSMSDTRTWQKKKRSENDGSKHIENGQNEVILERTYEDLWAHMPGSSGTTMSSYQMGSDSLLAVGIIGAGAAGLITAHVLLQDGFNVQVITRDMSVGGVWAKQRVYPGLAINKCAFLLLTLK